MTDTADMGQIARMYAEEGTLVFPVWGVIDGPQGLHCACPKAYKCTSPAKHPRIPPAHTKEEIQRDGKCTGGCGKVGHGLYDATADTATVDVWWGRDPRCGIAMPADNNGWAILDIDPKNGGEESFARLHAYVLDRTGYDLLNTQGARTGSGGMHLLYRAPDGGIINKAKAFGSDMPGIDTRGRGGYIVACPSRHISGGFYEWFETRELAPWPEILTALMHPPKPVQVINRPQRNGTGTRYAEAALSRELELVRAAPEGTRNHTLNMAAFKLGRFIPTGELSEQTVHDELAAAAASIGLGFSETEKTIRSGLSSRSLERAA